MLRCLQLLLVGLLGALPLAVAEDGPNCGGGDSGVWILPRISNLGGSLGSGIIASAPARATRRTSIDKPFTMRVSNEMGAPTGFLTEIQTGVALPLSINGAEVTILASTMQALANAGVTLAAGSIVDVRGRGYLLRVVIDVQNRTATIEIL
jgi:hypothetical protein